MWERVLQLLAVSCRHRHVSQPFPVSSNQSSSRQGDWLRVSDDSSGHYVVCLDCGKHFAYDWSQMRVVR